MDSETFIMLSSALSFGAPMALAVRELLVLRRDDRRRRGDGGGSWRRGPAPDKPPPPPPAPAGKKPLPDCLIPKPVPRPAARPRRVLEDA